MIKKYKGYLTIRSLKQHSNAQATTVAMQKNSCLLDITSYLHGHSMGKLI